MLIKLRALQLILASVSLLALHASALAGESSTYVPKSQGTMLTTTKLSKGQIVLGKDVPKLLAKSMVGRYSNTDAKPISVTVATEFYKGSELVKRCQSKEVTISPSAPLAGNAIISAISDAVGCLMADGSARDRKLSIQRIGLTDGKPVNLGLWSRNKTKEANFVIGVSLTPTNTKTRTVITSKTEAFSLRYPIEHG